jgi:hypothetical protein
LTLLCVFAGICPGECHLGSANNHTGVNMQKQWSLAALAMVVSMGVAQHSVAGEAYAGIGLPGIFAGYAEPLNEQWTVRADYATLGSRSQDGSEDGINYKGSVKVGRLGVFADYFPGLGGFRVTGGLTFNQVKISLNSNFTGTQVDVGGKSFTAQGGDYFNAQIKLPSVTPFLGIGYGHHASKGWGFHADLGASLGRAKLSIDTNLVGRYGVEQADVDRETQELRDGVGKVRFLPQVSIGVNYAF